MPDLSIDMAPLVFPAITRVYEPNAQPLLSAAMAELHTQIAQLPPDAKAAISGALDVHGNAKLVLVGKVGHGWEYVVTGSRYDGQLSGMAGISKVFR